MRKYISAQESFYLQGILNDINEQDTSFLDSKYKNMMKCGASPDKVKIVQGQMYHIPKNLSSNVNLLYCMNLYTLESKLHKNSCWTFFQ